MAFADTLRLPYKLLAVVIASLLPAGVLAYLVIVPLRGDIDAARREQRGVEYLVTVKSFTRAALDHRRTVSDYLADTGRSDSVQVTRKAEAVESALRDLDTQEARLGGDDSRQALTQVREEWQAI